MHFPKLEMITVVEGCQIAIKKNKIFPETTSYLFKIKCSLSGLIKQKVICLASTSKDNKSEC